jgi:hypothetical protein
VGQGLRSTTSGSACTSVPGSSVCDRLPQIYPPILETHCLKIVGIKKIVIITSCITMCITKPVVKCILQL